MNDQIKKMHEAKLQRWDNAGLSAQIGGLMHDATQIVIARLGKKIVDKNITEIMNEIGETLNKLREVADAEKQPKPVDFDEAQELWDEKKQELYDEEAENEEIQDQIRREAAGLK